MRTDLNQTVRDFTPPAAHNQTIAPLGEVFWPSAAGFPHREILAADGKVFLDRYAQLVGFIVNRGANPVTIEFQQSADVIIAGWTVVRTHVIAAGGFLEIVEDVTAENIRIRASSVAGTVLSANIVLYPLSILESSRAAVAPDVVDLETKETIHQNAANAVGNGTDATLDGSFSGGRIQITSTAGIVAATIQFFGSVDGVNFVALEGRNQATGLIANNAVIGANANEIWEIETTGLLTLRCRLDAINPAAGVPTVTVISKIIEAATPDILKSWSENERAKVNPIEGQDGVAAGSGASDGLTQRVIVATDNPTYAASGAVAPARTEQVGGVYETVPSAITNGQLGRLLLDAYKRLVNPSYNNAVGADQNLDIAPDAANIQPVTVRASAILTAAFVASSPIPTGNLAFFTGIGVYTRGAVGGAPSLYIELGRTVGGTTYWYPLSQQEANVLVAGSDGYLQTQGVNFTTTAKTAAAEPFPMVVPLNGADQIRISSREIGVPGTPGTLAIYGGFQNRGTLPAPATDSKAFEIASNSLRQQEVNPLSEQYVEEPLGVNVTNIAANTYHYPSVAGGTMGPHSVIDVDFTVSGGVTVTFEVSYDGGTVWKDISLSMVDQQTGLGGTASWVDTSACLTKVLNAPKWRVKYVTSDATNDIEISVRKRAL